MRFIYIHSSTNGTVQSVLPIGLWNFFFFLVECRHMGLVGEREVEGHGEASLNIDNLYSANSFSPSKYASHFPPFSRRM